MQGEYPYPLRSIKPFDKLRASGRREVLFFVLPLILSSACPELVSGSKEMSGKKEEKIS
jgi:hypothetical protein